MDKRFKKQQKAKNQQSKENTKVERVKCDCECREHELVNNCYNCGRIVCKKEGPGPCLFCGREVNYNQARGGRNPVAKEKTDKYYDDKFLLNDQPNNSPSITEEFLNKRDRLLEFDRNNTSQTSVIDDECDYFSANNTWLSQKERKKLKELENLRHEQKHASRMKKKITVDFSGREIEDDLEDGYDMATIANTIVSANDEIKKKYDDLPRAFDNLIYSSDTICNQNIIEEGHMNSIGSKIQDKTYLEILDAGVCLSLHQPYASLLVRGIKTVEGRTWYTSHRGRLWIASAAKEPSPEETKGIENFYYVKYEGKVQFPKSYPTGCLLGCVSVVDVLPQEEYNKLGLEEENDSPYIFVCDNFIELPLKYPIQGKHKIWKLDQTIHRAALNTLEKATKKSTKS